MRQLTICNYCTLMKIRAQAKLDGLEVSLRGSTHSGGLTVYVHPKEVKGPEKQHDQYFKAWLLQISNKCCC